MSESVQSESSDGGAFSSAALAEGGELLARLARDWDDTIVSVSPCSEAVYVPSGAKSLQSAA